MQYLNAGLNSGLPFDLYTYVHQRNKWSIFEEFIASDLGYDISYQHRSFFLQPKQCLNKNPKFLAYHSDSQENQRLKELQQHSKYVFLAEKCSLHILLFWDVTHFIQISSQRQTHTNTLQGSSLKSGYFTIRTKAINPSFGTLDSRLEDFSGYVAICRLWPWQSLAISSDRSPISMSHKVKQSKIQVDCTALKSKRQKKKVEYFAVASCNISLSVNKQGQRSGLTSNL